MAHKIIKFIIAVMCLIVMALPLCAVDSLIVNGRVMLDSSGLSNVSIATARTDSLGYYSLKIPAGIDSTLVPRLNAYLFEPNDFHISASDTILDSVNFIADRQIKKVIVISGQSNTGSSGLPQYFIPDEADDNIPYYLAYSGREHGFSTLGPISNFGIYTWSNFGLEILLTRTIYKHYTDSLAVMKIGWGGTSLYNNWSDSGSTWLWAKQMYDSGEAMFREKGYEPEYIGFFWYQGESDRSVTASPVYSDNLIAFVDRIRERFPNKSELDSLPFVCVRIFWNPESIYEAPVRAAQMDIVNHRTNTAWIDIDDCDPYRVSESNIHYNGVALNRIGYKLATAYLDLVGHPLDSSANVSIDIEEAIDTDLMLWVEGDTNFTQTMTERSFTFPSRLGDSLNVKLLFNDGEVACDPLEYDIPFVYDQSAILDGFYTFTVNPVVSIKEYPENIDHVLMKAYPNPFNPNTAISFQLPDVSDVTLSIYNISGKKVATLVDMSMEAGTYRIDWHAGDKPSGLYVARLQAGEEIVFQKLTLLK